MHTGTARGANFGWQAALLVALLGQGFGDGEAGRDAAGDEVVELARIERLVGGAASDPQIWTVGALDQAVDVHPRRQQPEAGQGAAVDPPETGATGGGDDVERLAAQVQLAASRQGFGKRLQLAGVGEIKAVRCRLRQPEFAQDGGPCPRHPAEPHAVQP